MRKCWFPSVIPRCRTMFWCRVSSRRGYSIRIQIRARIICEFRSSFHSRWLMSRSSSNMSPSPMDQEENGWQFVGKFSTQSFTITQRIMQRSSSKYLYMFNSLLRYDGQGATTFESTWRSDVCITKNIRINITHCICPVSGTYAVMLTKRHMNLEVNAFLPFRRS